MISTSRICISPKETPEFCYAGFNSLAEKFPASDTVPISSKRHAHGRELCAVCLGIILLADGLSLTG